MKVLVTDDDPTSRLMMQATVEQLGHDCLVAEDGQEAWSLFRDRDPDVVVSDWLMPGVDGLELCRRIRDHDTGGYTYFVLVTAQGEREHVRTGMDAGADDYLTKPLDPFFLETRLIAAARVTTLHKRLERYRTELARQASTDPLTQLRNRLSLDDDLVRLHAQATRYDLTYAVLMCDIDWFKGYNDAYGHQAGDHVLREVAAALRQYMRDADSTYRIGGEEFLIVALEQDLDSARTAGERARRAVSDLGLPTGSSVYEVVTVSVGVAVCDPTIDATAEDVLKRADEALYTAKRAGRNRVAARELDR